MLAQCALDVDMLDEFYVTMALPLLALAIPAAAIYARARYAARTVPDAGTQRSMMQEAYGRIATSTVVVCVAPPRRRVS